MLDLEILRDERESGFNNWFDTWWEKADIENKIVDRNAAGYTWIRINLSSHNESDYTINRYEDPLLLERLKNKLPGFNCGIKWTNAGSIALQIDWGV